MTEAFHETEGVLTLLANVTQVGELIANKSRNLTAEKNFSVSSLEPVAGTLSGEYNNTKRTEIEVFRSKVQTAIEDVDKSVALVSDERKNWTNTILTAVKVQENIQRNSTLSEAVQQMRVANETFVEFARPRSGFDAQSHGSSVEILPEFDARLRTLSLFCARSHDALRFRLSNYSKLPC
jgi:hypothetical protein